METTYSNATGEGGWIAFCMQNDFQISEPMRVKTPSGETKHFPLREGDSGKGRYIIAHFDTEDITTADEKPEA